MDMTESDLDQERDAARERRRVEADRRAAEAQRLWDAANEEAEGKKMQADLRGRYGIPKSQCVGCYLGDDGPSMHDYDYACLYHS